MSTNTSILISAAASSTGALATAFYFCDILLQNANVGLVPNFQLKHWTAVAKQCNFALAISNIAM